MEFHPSLRRAVTRLQLTCKIPGPSRNPLKRFLARLPKPVTQLVALLACTLAFAISSAPAEATSPVSPSVPLYDCTSGLCEGYTTGCPQWPTLSPAATLRACAEANYNGNLRRYYGTLTLLNVFVHSSGYINYTWQSQGNGIYTGGLEPDTAGQDVPSTERNLGEGSCPCRGRPVVGNPINASTGNKFEKQLDYQSPTDFPLTFHRFYNSASGGDGTIGVRWTHTYSRILVWQSSTEIKLFRDDGEVRYFYQCGTLWCPTADEIGALTQATDGNGNTIAWQYTDENAVDELYDGGGRFLSETAPSGLEHTFTYDNNGRLSVITDSFGRKLTLTYDSSSRIAQVTAPDATVLAYGYDAAGNLSTVTYPDQKVRTYLYDEAGAVGTGASTNLLTGILDEAGQRFATFNYDGQSRGTLTSHAAGAGQVQIAYNANGSSTITDALGSSRTYTFQAVQNVSYLSTVSGPSCRECGLYANYQFSTVGDLTGTTDFNGNATSSTYNSAHLEQSRIEASGTSNQRTINTTWNNTFRTPLTRAVLDNSGNAVSLSSWTYNARGQVSAFCQADSAVTGASSYTCGSTGAAPAGVRQWTYAYCNALDGTQCPVVGLLLSTTGPRTDLTQTTSYGYFLTSSATSCGTPGAACYQAGDLHTVTDALGHVTTINSYDGAGRITRVTNANGVTTDLTYTPRGWLASRSVNGATSNFTYTPYGAVQSVTDPDGVAVTYGYDAAHRLVKVTDALGNYIQYTLDAAGNKTAEQVYDSGGTLRKSLSRTFNTLGQVTQITDGLSHAVFNAGYSDSYDGNGNLVHSANASGIQRKLGYDGLNRLISTIENYGGSDTATQNTQSVFAYDTIGRLQGVADPDGLNTIYGYDGLSNATSVQSPDTGGTSYVYDAAGNVTQRTDANGVTSTHTYDALNRRTATTYSNSTLNVTYGYDEANSVTGCASSYPVGRLTRVIELSVTTVYCYDAHGNVTQKSQTQGTATDITGYGYTAADRLSSTVTPSGTSEQYTRDAAGRVSGVTVLPPGTGGAGAGNVVTAISYLPFGPIASYTLGNGQTVTRTYDANYALTDIVSPALNLHFARDAMGNITALGNASGANPATETYSYDPLYRLTGLKDANGNPEESYTYSKTGDRLSKTARGLATGTYTYQTGTHHLTGIGNTTRTFDANGNTTSSSVAGNIYGFGYNGRNRMTVVQSNGSTVGTYTYNALGQRTAKVATFPVASNQRFVYDEGSRLLGEYGSNTRDYIWLGNLPVAVVDTAGTTSTLSYVHADGLNTPRVVADSSGNTMWRLAYQGNPFGEQQPTSANGFVYNFRFAGQYYDTESGLANNVNRDQEAATGRYLQSDPIGLFARQSSTYTYVGGNPLSYVDAIGLQAENERDLLEPIDVAEPFNAAAYRDLFGQIKQYDPDFEDPVVSRAEPTYTRADVERLEGVLRGKMMQGCRAPAARQSPEINPADVAGLKPHQIDAFARRIGLDARGPDPMNGRGAYLDPVTGNQRILSHPDAEPPHAHVNDASGQRLDINGNNVPPESPGAHLPLGG